MLIFSKEAITYDITATENFFILQDISPGLRLKGKLFQTIQYKTYISTSSAVGATHISVGSD